MGLLNKDKEKAEQTRLHVTIDTVESSFVKVTMLHSVLTLLQKAGHVARLPPRPKGT